MATINGNLSRQVSKKIITEDARKQALNRIVSTEDDRRARRLRSGDRERDREEEIKRKIFHDVARC